VEVSFASRDVCYAASLEAVIEQLTTKEVRVGRRGGVVLQLVE
jgi:hypothetical protein